MKAETLLIALCVFFISSLYAQQSVKLDTTLFYIKPENRIEFQGRACLKGEAYLKDSLFENGIIEFDIWTDGEHAYPGIKFRFQPDGTCEHLYLRPHASGKDIAVQYAPSFKGETCWQLYHGKGFTTKYDLPRSRWMHFKVQISDHSATLFLDNKTTPVLEMDLVISSKQGQVIFETTGKETYFSNFKVEKTDFVGQKQLPLLYAIDNKEWNISKLQQSSAFNAEIYPRFFPLFYAGWEKVDSDVNGLLNISKYRKPVKGKQDCVYVRKMIYSESDKIVKMAFGYSDAIKVFMNEQLVYSGNYAYKSRGSTFSGNIGLYDTLYLRLNKGINEIFTISKNSFGGWGFIFKPEYELASVPTLFESTQKKWDSKKSDLLPESVVYDKKRAVLYYSNFDPKGSKKNYPSGYISKVDMEGNIVESMFIDSLNSPTGICLQNDVLYITERDGLSCYSISSKKLIGKYAYPHGMKFANDIAVAEDGNVYITNTDTKSGIVDIYILQNNHIEPWLSSEQLSQLNGILYDNGYLIVGNSGKNLLQKINIETKEIQTITCLGSGVIDGIQKDENGNYLVSLWRGELLRITESGDVACLLRSDNTFNIADFEYVSEREELIIPSFSGKNIKCYKLKK